MTYQTIFKGQTGITKAVYHKFQNVERGAFLEQNNLIHELIEIFKHELEKQINKRLSKK